MIVLFEELSAPKRAGGIDSACTDLCRRLESSELTVIRSSKVAKKSRHSRPDCVHVQGIWSPVLAKRFWRWKAGGVPCIVSPHGMLSEWALAYKPLRKKVAWWLYQGRILNQATVVHVTSEQEASQLVELGIKSNVVVIPWGVDAPELTKGDRTHDGSRTAIFVGRLCPVKGLPMLFEAWQKVKPVGWRLRVIGPDEAGYRTHLEAIVRERGLAGEVRFDGRYKKLQIQQALADAHLFILPSYSENFGLVIGEALAMGVPVLTTRGTPWKRIADTNCGWWVPPTPEAIVSALQAATVMPASDLRQMGAIGAELIRHEFSWDTTINKFYELYKSIAANSKIQNS